jgi:hypothetical protein
MAKLQILGETLMGINSQSIRHTERIMSLSLNKVIDPRSRISAERLNSRLTRSTNRQQKRNERLRRSTINNWLPRTVERRWEIGNCYRLVAAFL